MTARVRIATLGLALLAGLAADGPAAEDEEAARDGLHAGGLAVGPDALELAQARDGRYDRI